MNDKIRRFWRRLQTIGTLPTGRTQFDKWSKSIVDRYNNLTGNDLTYDSGQFALAAMIVNLGPTQIKKPKRYFLKALLKTSANQVASQIFIEIKEKQKAAELAAKEVASDGASGVPTA